MKTYTRLMFPFIAFFFPLFLYTPTLAPAYIPVDSAEFALCIQVWGVCHPPGFPLYILIGKIFTQLFPFGSLIYKANLLSALFGAGTILLIYLTLIKLQVRTHVALLLSLLLAVSPTFWEFSIAADVFTFNTFLLAVTFFLAFSKRRLLSFFVLGLSASHFYLSAILFPLFIWYYWGFKPGFKLLVAAVIFLLGLFPQVIMYFRMRESPSINWGHVQNLSDFFNFVTRKEFGSFFLISNPVLTFSLMKFFRHIVVYFYTLSIHLGIILPVVALVCIFFGKVFKNRSIRFLFISFLSLLFIQLLTISTIDPITDKAFQINKFYLSSFLVAILLIGIAFTFLTNRKLQAVAPFFLTLLIVGSLAFNFKNNDYSKNYFSKNLVLDALSQLPPHAIAITTNHTFYFGSVYEQMVSGKFADVNLLYFPNENNRDAEKYDPEIFANNPNEAFVTTVTQNSDLKNIKPFVAEKYILETIARNLDKPVFILQGTHEELFFNYLKPYLSPYGLWWRITAHPNDKVDIEQNLSLLQSLINNNIKTTSFHQYQQQRESLIYAVSYHSAGIAFAKEGKYSEALIMLKKSQQVDEQSQNVRNEIILIEKTKIMVEEMETMVREHNKDRLMELGSDLVTIGNYKAAVDVFLRTITLDPNDARLYNNIASSYALMDKKEQAKEFYIKALSLDPNLELAKKGLEALTEKR